MADEYSAGMMAALDGGERSTRRSDKWLEGYDFVMDIGAKLESGEYHPSHVRFALNPGVTGNPEPWDGKAYTAGQKAAKDRRPYDPRQKYEWGTGYSNQLLYEAFQAEDTGAAQITDWCLREEAENVVDD